MTYQTALRAVFKLLVILSISSGISLPLKAAEPDQSEIDWTTLVNHQQFLETRLADIEKYLEEDELYQLEADGVSQERFANYRELIDTKLDALEARSQAGNSVSQKDMDALKGLLKAMSADFDRALGQQNVRIRDMDSNQKTFGVIFTVLGILIGIAGIFSISGRVISQTEEASEKWFDKNADDLKKQINSFEQELYLLKKQTEQHAEKVSDEMSEMSKILQKDLANKTIDPNSKESDQTVALTDKESKTLSDSETELQSKPESSYTFNDWNTRAFSAYYGQKLNDAAFYWDKATKLSNASKKQISRALFNKGYARTT